MIDIPEDENCIIAPVVESPTLEAMLGFVITNEPLELVLWGAGTKQSHFGYSSQQQAQPQLPFYASPDYSWIFCIRTETGTRRKWFPEGDLKPIGYL